MKKLGIIVGVIAILIATLSCLTAGSWHYKITVNVETPEGMKSGFAVRKVTVSDHLYSYLPEASRSSVRFEGEAVAVDLGARGVLFAPMNTDDYNIVFKAFPKEGALTWKGINYYRFLKAGPKELTPEQYPRLVRFKDMTDPKTVELVLDAGMEDRKIYEGNGISSTISEYVVRSDNFEKLFGKGVKLHSITIEMTGEKVTQDIENKLPWVRGYPEEPVLPEIKANDFSAEAQLRKGHFIRR